MANDAFERYEARVAEEARGTGKTKKRLEQAVKLAREGRVIVFVVTNRKMIGYCKRMVKKFFADGLTTQYSKTLVYGRGRVEWHLEGRHVDQVIYDDPVSAPTRKQMTEAEQFAAKFQAAVTSRKV